MPDSPMVAMIVLLDQEVDLTVVHVVLTAACACAAIVVMQCLTRHAHWTSVHGCGLLLLRATLGLFSIALMFAAATPLAYDEPPWAMDVVCRGLLLVVLVTVPIALPRRREIFVA